MRFDIAIPRWTIVRRRLGAALALAAFVLLAPGTLARSGAGGCGPAACPPFPEDASAVPAPATNEPRHRSSGASAARTAKRQVRKDRTGRERFLRKDATEQQVRDMFIAAPGLLD